MNKESRIGHCIRYSELTPQEKEEFIEPGIRSLVSTLNSLPGVDTFASCEGHSPEDCREDQVPNTAYVAFYCKHEEVLKQILINFKDQEGFVSLFDKGFYPDVIAASQKMEISYYPEYHNHIVYTMRFKAGQFKVIPRLLLSASGFIDKVVTYFKINPLDELPIAESGQ